MLEFERIQREFQIQFVMKSGVAVMQWLDFYEVEIPGLGSKVSEAEFLDKTDCCPESLTAEILSIQDSCVEIGFPWCHARCKVSKDGDRLDVLAMH